MIGPMIYFTLAPTFLFNFIIQWIQRKTRQVSIWRSFQYIIAHPLDTTDQLSVDIHCEALLHVI